jgi:hypothetical protein
MAGHLRFVRMRQDRPRPSHTREGRSSLFVRKRLAPASGPAGFVRAHRPPGQDASGREHSARPHGPGHLSEHCDCQGKTGPVANPRPTRTRPGICPNAATARARWVRLRKFGPSARAQEFVRTRRSQWQVGPSRPRAPLRSLGLSGRGQGIRPNTATAKARWVRLQSPGRSRRPWAFVRTPRTQGRPASQCAARRFGPTVRHHPAAALTLATVPDLRTDAASVARSAHRARIRGALRYTTL